jgi:hypothetical protein
MSNLRRSAAALAVASCVVLAGCSSGTITPPAVTNMSGDYGGTMQDAQNGTGTATATFAQHGANVGGAVTIVRTSGTVTADASFTLSTSNTIVGTLVIDYPTQQCTYATTGTFDTSDNTLTATYSAITNCAGDTGSYSLTQACSATADSDARHALSVANRC